ncbi:MAG: hypothetical protein ACR2LI_12375 [Propionibacteriaceae bacterium]
MPSMPAPSLRLRAASGEVGIGADGGIAGVEHDGRPGEGYVRTWGPRTATVGGVTSDWVQSWRTEDTDECEVGYEWRADRRLRLEVRHAVEPVWSERWVLELVASEPAADQPVDDAVDVAELVVELVLGPTMVGWGYAAGAEARVAVLPVDGLGPVLAARLQAGSIVAVEEGRMHTGPVRLRPGQRYAVSWRLDWYATPLQVQQRFGSTLPPGSALAVGEVWDLATDPDRVVLAPEELSVRDGERSTEITARRPGRYRIELRSARGTVLAEVAWAPTLADTVAARTSVVLAETPRTQAGTPRLPDAATALVLQYAVGSGLVDDHELAAEAAELFVGELVEGPDRRHRALDAFAQIVVAREVIRGGDPSLLDLPTGHDGPGAGLAAAQSALAGIVTGRRQGRLEPAGPAAERALLAPGSVSPAELLGYVRALGAELGSGLPGHDLRPSDAAGSAYRIVLLGLVPESLGPELEREWDCSVPTLADRARAGLLAVPDLSMGALAWLCVAEPQRT